MLGRMDHRGGGGRKQWRRGKGECRSAENERGGERKAGSRDRRLAMIKSDQQRI